MSPTVNNKLIPSPQIVIIVVFIVSDVFTKVNTDDWQNAFMGFTLFTVIIFNIMVAVFQVFFSV